MSFAVMLAVLGAAALHALWNSLVKIGASRLQAMVAMSLGEAAIGLVVGLSRPGLIAAAWPYLLASGVVHFFYKFFLSQAYERGDLSRVYPISRGTAPLLVALVSAFFLRDVLRPLDYAGIAVLGLGILAMAHGALQSGENRRLIPFALGAAAATATYTLIDGTGARVAGDAAAFVAWCFVADGVGFTLIMLAWKGRELLPDTPGTWSRGMVAGGASYAAYAVSVWAMTVAPIALVAALRETSILFAVLIGRALFAERLTPAKGVAAVIIVGGVLLTRAG